MADRNGSESQPSQAAVNEKLEYWLQMDSVLARG